MKSEHRHELKSNELADWLNNLPQWCKDNLGTILTVIAAIIIVGGFFGWRFYTKDIVQAGEQEQFTKMIDAILSTKSEVVSQQMNSQTSDMSFLLGNKAKEMKEFAQSAKNKDMAALALIKAADSIRSELHFRNEIISKADVTEKINEAKNLYLEANVKSPSENTIRAAASFGLGLCEEELGNFDEAENIYKSIRDNEAYKGTVVFEEVNVRLNTMSDYKNNIVFLPAPPPAAPDANAVLDPLVQQLRNASKKFIDSNAPKDVNLPVELKNDANLPAAVVPPMNETNPNQDINNTK